MYTIRLRIENWTNVCVYVCVYVCVCVCVYVYVCVCVCVYVCDQNCYSVFSALAEPIKAKPVAFDSV